MLVVSLRRRRMDPPGERKIHTGAASRLGGLVFFPALVLAIGVALLFGGGFSGEEVRKSIFCACAGAMVYGLGAADDLSGVCYRQKLLVQLMAASFVAVAGIWIRDGHGFLGIGALSPFVGMPLTVLLLVFVMNAVNLIDGLDGLAAGLAIGTWTVYGTFFLLRGEALGATAAVAGLGILFPFFYYNVRGIRPRSRSKIFMGDAGSLTVGGLLGVLAVGIWNLGDGVGEHAPVWAMTPLLIPCFDALRVFFVRIVRRRPLFLPDNSHIHHRLLQRGFSPGQVLGILAAGQLFLLGVNAVLAEWLSLTALVAIDGGLFVLGSRALSAGARSAS